MNPATSVVTGAFGFSGQEIAKRLLARGERVRTLTNHPRPQSSLFRQVEVHPLEFSRPEQLTESLRGASVLYSTYWVRFPYGGLTHQRAVENTVALIRAAEAAGVGRIVHVSITNPSLASPLTYFRGKGEVEAAIQGSSLSYAILRPAVLFGSGDILLNNIACLLRRSPLFAVPGDGRYGIQPIFVEDLAELAVQAGARSQSFVTDAVGPETYTYLELVKLLRGAVGSRALIVPMAAWLVRLASSALGMVVKDVVLTREEIEGLMAGLLVSGGPPTGKTSLREWVKEHASEIGGGYASEVRRHYAARR